MNTKPHEGFVPNLDDLDRQLRRENEVANLGEFSDDTRIIDNKTPTHILGHGPNGLTVKHAGRPNEQPIPSGDQDLEATNYYKALENHELAGKFHGRHSPEAVAIREYIKEFYPNKPQL